MSDFIFVTEETESSGKQSENNNKLGRGTTYTKGTKKNGEKKRVCTIGAKIEREAASS